MEIKRISNGEMPPANKYVLIFVPGRPWLDSDDEYGKFWKVAKCVYGIDKIGNSQKPYRFKEFGPGDYLGQEVDIWCELPVTEVKELEG